MLCILSSSHLAIGECHNIKPYKDLLITFGYDRNKDDLFEGNTEPRFIMKYDFQSDSLFPIVEKKLEMEIQKLIDKN